MRITPTKEPKSKTEVYIPCDLDDCFVELKKMLPSEFVNEIQSSQLSSLAHQHFRLGLWMRNNWGLWSSSRLAKFLREKGIDHPDRMSNFILESFWKHLNNLPIDFSTGRH